MNHIHPRHLWLALLFAGALVPAPADEPAKPAAPDAKTTPAETKPADQETIVLPKIQVTATRIKAIDKEIAKLDKLITRERAKVKSTDLDRTLNNKRLSTAAALFGGNSAEHLSAVAASRVSILEAERSILEDMKRPISLETLAALEAELDQLRTTRRNLDNVNVPH